MLTSPSGVDERAPDFLSVLFQNKVLNAAQAVTSSSQLVTLLREVVKRVSPYAYTTLIFIYRYILYSLILFYCI